MFERYPFQNFRLARFGRARALALGAAKVVSLGAFGVCGAVGAVVLAGLASDALRSTSAGSLSAWSCVTEDALAALERRRPVSASARAAAMGLVLERDGRRQALACFRGTLGFDPALDFLRPDENGGPAPASAVRALWLADGSAADP